MATKKSLGCGITRLNHNTVLTTPYGINGRSGKNTLVIYYRDHTFEIKEGPRPPLFGKRNGTFQIKGEEGGANLIRVHGGVIVLIKFAKHNLI